MRINAKYKKGIKVGIITGFVYKFVLQILTLFGIGYTHGCNWNMDETLIYFFIFTIIFGGVIIGLIIGVLFTFFYDKLPGETPMVKSYVFFLIWFLVLYMGIGPVSNYLSKNVLFTWEIYIYVCVVLISGFVLGKVWDKVSVGIKEENIKDTKAKEILKQRYAKGEINKEEYNEMKKEIEK